MVDPTLRRFGTDLIPLRSVLLKIRYNLTIMNKRAKKRLKEAIEKEKQERDKALPPQKLGPAKHLQEMRGFLPKPPKKRP